MTNSIDFESLQFHTTRLVIRPLERADFEVWVAGYVGRKPPTDANDGRPMKPGTVTRAKFNSLVKSYQQLAASDQIYFFGVFLKATGQHIGSLDFATLHRNHFDWANVGYEVHNTHQKQGLGRELLKAGLKLGFNELHYKRLEAAIQLDNRPSIRLAKSVGFKRECVRQQFYFEAGKWRDLVVYVAISKSKLSTSVAD